MHTLIPDFSEYNFSLYCLHIMKQNKAVCNIKYGKSVFPLKSIGTMQRLSTIPQLYNDRLQI